MAYTPRMVAALSGATLRQLSYWRHESSAGVMLAPEISAAPRVLYSFRDLLALRTCVFLRQGVSLQKIRKAIGNLREFGELEHLSAYELVADGDTVLLLSGNEAIDLVKSPGQHVLVVMSRVIEPFPARAGVVVPHLFQPREHVALDPQTQGGHPVVSGTRVPYEVVAELVRDGVPGEEVKDYYPPVSAAAARDAADFALYVDSYDTAARAA